MRPILHRVRHLLAGVYLLVLLLNSPASAAAERPELRVGYVEFPPYEYRDANGHAAGTFVDMTRQVAEEAGFDLRFIYVPVSRAYLYLRQGEIDLWPGLTDIPALSDDVLESHTHPLAVQLDAWSTEANAPIQQFEDFYDKSLILIAGYTYGGLDGYLESHPRIRVTRAPDHRAAVDMLTMHRGDYLLDYQPPVEDILRREPGVHLQYSRIRSRTGAWLFSRANPEAEAIRRAFDDAWLRLVSRGEAEVLPERYSHKVPGFPLP